MFNIGIKDGILDERHYRNMTAQRSTSLWLFMWLVNKQTKENGKVGIVLGGKPIKYEDVKRDLGVTLRTYRRWIKNLSDHGYITCIRTPRGLSIRISNQKKRWYDSGTSDSTTRAHQGINSGTSNIRQSSRQSNKTAPIGASSPMAFKQYKEPVIEVDGMGESVTPAPKQKPPYKRNIEALKIAAWYNEEARGIKNSTGIEYVGKSGYKVLCEVLKKHTPDQTRKLLGWYLYSKRFSFAPM